MVLANKGNFDYTQTHLKEQRPALVQEALDNNRTLYCFGLGSNMLRSRWKIEVLMEPRLKLLVVGVPSVALEQARGPERHRTCQSQRRRQAL